MRQPPWDEGAWPSREPSALHEEIASSVNAGSDLVALDGEGQSYTFLELERASNRIANGLLAHGPLERPVALVAGNCPASVVAILGVLKAGGACAPLDPREPSERLAPMVEQIDAGLVITDGSAPESVRALPVDQISTPALAASSSDDRPNVVVDPQAPALVYMTSGSTGRPKAITHTHSSLVRQLWGWNARRDFLDATYRAAVLFPIPFLGGVIVFGSALLVGAPSFFYDVTTHGVDGLAEWLAANAITQSGAVPSVWHALAQSAAPRGVVVETLRSLTFGGEEFAVGDLPALRKVFPAATMFNCYGTQEAGTFAIYVVEPTDGPESGRLPAGWVVPGYAVALVDDTGAAVPPGEIGEIVVSGPEVARGYLGDAELSAEKYMPWDGDIALRTGDTGRFRPDGLLEVLGRLDRRVKVHGQGVDLVEVEAALSRLDDVREVALTPVIDAQGRTRVVAHLVPEPGAAPSVAELRSALDHALPRYAIPGRFVLADHMPRTQRGKTDRIALRDEALAALRRTSVFVAPRDDREQRLAELFSEVLGIDDVGADDDFFDLGGDSLGALELLTAITEEFHVDLTGSTLLEAPTPALLAEAMRAGGSDPVSVVPLTDGPSDRAPFFCVAGGGAHAMSQRALARRLRDRAVYGIHAGGVEERAEIDRTVEARATRHLSEIRKFAPHGPYVIGGHSFGGIVACEIASQLRALDEEVALLVLLDSGPPGDTGYLEEIAADLAEKYPGRNAGDRVRRTTRTVYIRARRRVLRVASRWIRLNRSQRSSAFWDLNRSMGRRYVAPVFDRPVLMLRTEDADITGDAREALPDRGWSEALGQEVAVVGVPGRHETMLREPYVADIAHVIDDHLDARGV